MLTYIKSEINKLEGNVLGIGLDKKLTKVIDNNKKIINCDLLEDKSDGKGSSDSSSEIINIKELTKKYKKKIDCLIINFDSVMKYDTYILKYMNNLPKNETIIYNVKELEKFEKRLNKLEINYKTKDNILIIYPNKKCKNKVKLYFYIDKINKEIDKLIEILNI